MTESEGQVIHLKANGPNDVSLDCDGVDLLKAIGGVSAVRFEATANTLPKILLEAVRPFEYEGPAEIHVMQAEPAAVTVIEFLNAINPAELETAAAERIEGMAGPTVGETFLLALKVMAEALDDA